MAILSANLQFNRGGHGLLDYSSLQKNYSTALGWAQDVNSNAAVGQFIYLEEAETIEGVEYAKGPYVVDAIGEGAVLTPLSKSVAGTPDLASLVSNLQGDVGTLKTGLATTDSSVKKLETTVADIPTIYATKAELETAIGDIDFSTLATKDEVSTGLAAKVDASTVYTKDEVDEELAKKLEANDVSTFATKSEVKLKANVADVYTKTDVDDKFVAQEGYVAYSQDEKDKLANLANIKSVGDNLSISESGELQVSIPEVEVPFQSVAEGDKLLTLSEGVLKSDVSFGLVDGKIQLTGKNNEVIGEVDTTDFVVDGVLDTVAWSKEEGKENILVLTWNTDSGKTAIEIDFGKYVDAYGAGEGITLTDKTFAVDYSKVERAGAAATAEKNAKDYANSLAVNYDASGAAASVEAKLDAYKESNDAALESGLAAKVDVSVYNNKMTEIDGSISAIKTDLSNVYTKDEVDGLVSPLATSEELTNGLATKLDASAKVNGVSFANGDATLDAGDIALETAITRTGEDGEVENVYAAEVSIQSVLASLSQRIDVLDPNVSGELGITSIVEGNGVKVVTSGGQATISVKASAVKGNMAEVKTDGVYVSDMRSYWEAI